MDCLSPNISLFDIFHYDFNYQTKQKERRLKARILKRPIVTIARVARRVVDQFNDIRRRLGDDRRQVDVSISETSILIQIYINLYVL